MTFHGVDVSHWQEEIDWARVAADGISFAIAKATDGTRSHDKKFTTNWAGARAAGIPRSAYHFARGSDASPTDQAQFFLDAVGPLEPGDMPLALDLEEPPKGKHETFVHTWKFQGVDPIEFALEFLPIVDDATGRRSIIYTGPSFIEAYGLDDRLTKWPLWIAHWDAPKPRTAPWSAALWWQTSDRGVVDGIKSGVIDGKLHLLDIDQTEVDPATLGVVGRSNHMQEDPDVPLSDADIKRITDEVTPAVTAELEAFIQREVVLRLHNALGEGGELERATKRIIDAINNPTP